MKLTSKSPIFAARELHLYLGWISPSDYSVEEIANALGVIVKDVPIKGSEGRVIASGNTGIISINSNISHGGKRNFIIAHEIAHFLLHQHLMAFFSDSDKTLSEWHQKGPHEREANIFATELLMPSELFTQKVTGKKLSISLIQDVSKFFNVSLLATFLRYIACGKFPVMVIYMENKAVKWKQASTDFPFQWLPIGSKVPVYTVAGDHFYNNSHEDKPVKVDAIEWFPEDTQIRYKRDWKLWEQCYPVSQSGLVSCLWTY